MRRSVRELARSSPYWPVVTHPVLRRVLPGFGVSYLGDGMSAVAVSWLALQLAPESARGTWVAVALAAYTLPGVAGALTLGRFLRGRGGAQLAGWDATLRACALAAIPAAHLFGVLGIELYVVLLAASSLLHSWGSAGRYTLLAEVLPRRDHLPANAVVATLAEFGTIVGPAVAAVLIAWGGATSAIAVDAATFAVLAASYRFAVPPGRAAKPVPAGASRETGFRIIRRNRQLVGLVALTFGFFFLYGPVTVALPLYVAEDLRASAGVLGGYYTAFGVGAVIGGLVAGYLRRCPLWPTTIGIVLGWGAMLMPLGLGVPVAVSMVSFAIGGLIYSPYMATSMALFQRAVRTGLLPQVLAARSALILLSVPLGTVLGGPLVALLGARGTLLLSAVATLMLGVIAAALAVLGGGRGGASTRRESDAPDDAPVTV